MKFSDEEVSDLLQVISGILMLGNINFLAAGGAQVADKSGKTTFNTTNGFQSLLAWSLVC